MAGFMARSLTAQRTLTCYVSQVKGTNTSCYGMVLAVDGVVPLGVG